MVSCPRLLGTAEVDAAVAIRVVGWFVFLEGKKMVASVTVEWRVPWWWRIRRHGVGLSESIDWIVGLACWK